MTHKQAGAVLVTLAFSALALAGAVSAQTKDLELKGVYREAQRTGVKVVIFRVQDANRTRVATDYEFKSGDRFDLELESNQASYVYVLNRTMVGDPNQLSSKGIDRIRDEDRNNTQGPRPKYKLLYPLANDPKATTANKAFQISGFRMDNQAGVEKVLVVYSAKPIDLSRYFDLNGNQRGSQPPARDGRRTGGGRADTDEDVLNQLDKELADWAANAQTALPKGVTRDLEGYGIVRDPNRPGLVDLTLRHFAK